MKRKFNLDDLGLTSFEYLLDEKGEQQYNQQGDTAGRVKIRQDVVDWIKINAPTAYIWDSYNESKKVTFSSNVDAVAFKLRWL